MSDRRTRELERAYQQDPSSDELFRALYLAYKRYDPDLALAFVRDDMIQSGDFKAWSRARPYTEEGAEDHVIADYERASGQYVDPAGFMANGPERKIAAGQVIFEGEDGDLQIFSDGPYVLQILHDQGGLERRMQTGAAEEDFIPFWIVNALYEPWRGIEQDLHSWIRGTRFFYRPYSGSDKELKSRFPGLFATRLGDAGAFVDAPYYSKIEGEQWGWEQNAHGLLLESWEAWSERNEDWSV